MFGTLYVVLLKRSLIEKTPENTGLLLSIWCFYGLRLLMVGLRLLKTLGRAFHPPKHFRVVIATHLGHFGAPFLVSALRTSVELWGESVELCLDPAPGQHQ